MSDSFHTHPVVFYNVENLFDTHDDVSLLGNEEFTPTGDKLWSEDRYLSKLEKLAEAFMLINGNTPLAFGMAEIENRRVIEDLIKTGELAKRNYRIVHYDSEDRRGMDCALVYDAGFIRSIVEQKLLIEVSDEPYFRTRDIIYMKAELGSGKFIHFFVNHWPSRREGISESENRRKAAASTLRKAIDRILDVEKHANILVMGDFNDTPDNFSIRNILRAKGQHEQQKGDLVNLLVEEQQGGLGTTVHMREWNVFDQLIVSQGLLQGQSGLLIEGNNAHIAHRKELVFQFRDGGSKPSATYGGDTYHGGYSDHLPVYLNIRLKP